MWLVLTGILWIDIIMLSLLIRIKSAKYIFELDISNNIAHLQSSHNDSVAVIHIVLFGGNVSYGNQIHVQTMKTPITVVGSSSYGQIVVASISS